MISKYETYPLSHIISVQAIVSADYLPGVYSSNLVHSHEQAWELCYCISGETVVAYNKNNLTLKQGQCLLIAPGVYHNINIHHRNATYPQSIIINLNSYFPFKKNPFFFLQNCKKSAEFPRKVKRESKDGSV